MDATTIAIALLGFGSAAAVGGATFWDAHRVGVSRPRLWATVTAGTVAVGFALPLFATVPLTGVLLTANTGPVLYGFEREVSAGGDEPAEPGELPGGPSRPERADEE
ncbi:hypothetical protein [Halovivax sp.]|uniref:hypothetical protein n=1 Tax=Halovivax sp. TaxID=1935978 RepID=UPI0025C58572|nr:hypothetical protein [Halovivax sp.]